MMNNFVQFSLLYIEECRKQVGWLKVGVGCSDRKVQLGNYGKAIIALPSTDDFKAQQ